LYSGTDHRGIFNPNNHSSFVPLNGGNTNASRVLNYSVDKYNSDGPKKAVGHYTPQKYQNANRIGGNNNEDSKLLRENSFNFGNITTNTNPSNDAIASTPKHSKNGLVKNGISSLNHSSDFEGSPQGNKNYNGGTGSFTPNSNGKGMYSTPKNSPYKGKYSPLTPLQKPSRNDGSISFNAGIGGNNQVNVDFLV